ncbi:MAG: ATP-binding protein [Saprospiraceae bacterium]|nr:ATP-binding protein [Saprospiraceae bacterium]
MQKIIFTGPESTGKSFLAKAIASSLGTLWVPEYARFYLSRLQRPYEQEDILLIAQGQAQWETFWEKEASGLLCCDTSLLVPKIWSEFKYNRVDPWITQQLDSRQGDFYFLCHVDLPWEYDPLREHPHLREALFERYRDALEQMQADYVVLSGSLEERKQSALWHIREKFSHLCELT